MKKIFIFIILLYLSTYAYSQNGMLQFQIDGYGNVDCNVRVEPQQHSDSGASSGPLCILLPFRIDNDLQLKIPDDLIYTFRTISKKYSLVNVLINNSDKEIRFSVQSINNYLPTIEGKAKIEVDLSYRDIPKPIFNMIKDNTLFYAFNVEWKVPRKLTDEEVSFYPPELVKKDSSGTFSIKFRDLSPTNRTTWFVYPNFKGSSDQNLQFYILLLAGILTGFAQLNPIIERKYKIIKYQATIGILLLVAFIIFYFIIPRHSFLIVRSLAAPILPHIAYILGGLIYLKVTEKYLFKISGVVRDELNEPMQYADVILYNLNDDINSPKTKIVKKIYELDNGRFEFSFFSKKSKGYTLKVSKLHRDTKIITIPGDREKSYDLHEIVVLKKIN